MSIKSLSKIKIYSFTDRFIERLAQDIYDEFVQNGQDLNRVAVVFGGKRPALFLKRQLGKLVGKNFFSPRFFSIDEWMTMVVQKDHLFGQAGELDHCYTLFNIARAKTPEILKGRESFAQFLPWTREILKFIEQLDLEDVGEEKLLEIGVNAKIGYPVPADINRLLQSVAVLRREYHRFLQENRIYSRGYQYLQASRLIEGTDLQEFDQVLFCNFFYLHRTEAKVMKTLIDRNQARLVVQGDERKWPAFERLSAMFGVPIREGAELDIPKFDLKLYAAFDMHSEVGLVREVLKNITDKQQTVIVLPNPDMIIPLLSEVSSIAKDFNISMGYPLKRSSLSSLLESIFEAQLSRKGEAYYTRDLLKVLRHPFVKNLELSIDPAVCRVLIHKIEEILTGQAQTAISGTLFLNLKELLNHPELYALTQQTLDHMNLSVTHEGLKAAMMELSALLFVGWESIGSFRDFAATLSDFLGVFTTKSFLHHYPLNIKIADRMQDLIDELNGATFRNEAFPKDELFKIFKSRLENEIVAFHGSPLKGLQILGLFETRSLNFEHVIVLDVNEGTLPRLNIYEPLIPREVMINLNLDRLECEEEIQRYQFMRLISSAKTVHLIYQERQDKEKSRFVEELIWEEEKKRSAVNVLPVVRPAYEVKVGTRERSVNKTPQMVEFLRQHTYSASSINAYLRNPMDFYYNYVLGLKEREDLLEEPENRQVGTFIHELLEIAFKPFVGRKPVLDDEFRAQFFQLFEARFAQGFGRTMSSDAFLLKSVIQERLKHLLDKEEAFQREGGGEIVFIESRFEDRIPLPAAEIKCVYRVDRVDRLGDGSILILDYKAGSIDPMPKALGEIEAMTLSRENVRDTVKSFQIPLYFYYFDKMYPDRPINAAFYNLRTAERHAFLTDRMPQDRKEINRIFLKALDFVIAEILNPDIPFTEDLTFV